MDSTSSFLLTVSPTTTTSLPGMTRFQLSSPRLQLSGDATQLCAVLVALERIEVDECPQLLYASHTWPRSAVPRNLATLPTWKTSLERGDCIALNLYSAWKLRAVDVEQSSEERPESWRSKAAVIVFGGDDVVSGGGRPEVEVPLLQVWFDELRGLRGSTPTTVVQWSKGVPPPNQQHYT